MTLAEIGDAAYADGYGDATLEVGSGAPPMPIWDSRFEYLADKATEMDTCTLMYHYYVRHDDGWVDGAHDVFHEDRIVERGFYEWRRIWISMKFGRALGASKG